jgi:hypothetical protein
VIAVRVCGPEEIKRRLAPFGTELVDPTSLKTAGKWRTMWDYYFTVPQYGPDKCCGEYELEKIIADLERRRPVAH